MKNLINKTYLVLGFVLLFSFTGCKKDEYYLDGGKANANFNGTMLEYLKFRAVPFDTIATIVKLAGMEDVFNKEDITFFAPTDYEVKEMIGSVKKFNSLNAALYRNGKDTIKTLADIEGATWAKFLQRHIFKGAKKLADYPQLDPDLTAVYPGQNYYAYNNTAAKIGVIYGDVGGVKYIGYRRLTITYIADLSSPDQSFNTLRVSSSDIKPNNGVVHALQLSGDAFGLGAYEMINEISNR
ncbi:fasciclin domain-containing protein [Pedobacter nyackensis]|uniref:Fasciclin domain-containing protein n=1 Tax=Pedobacter nyackensis TaxID=475255 RepID=A0A1W2CQX3_9SPHI|nr:fasciclin domain-containing protein [Pedobacter nyackensis]SMC87282.1 Fasciclin domain-containing protein [Pedobacter nyackensis]